MRAVMVAGALLALATWMAPPAGACDPGSFYDPRHEICQPNAPDYPWGPTNDPSYPQLPKRGLDQP